MEIAHACPEDSLGAALMFGGVGGELLGSGSAARWERAQDIERASVAGKVKYAREDSNL